MPIKKKKFEGLFVNPFSEAFLEKWELWKEYKYQTFRFKYATPMSEQAAANELVELSDGDEDIAKKIINQSMSNQWRGLFRLKTLKSVAGGKQPITNQEARERVNSAVNDRLRRGRQTGNSASSEKI